MHKIEIPKYVIDRVIKARGKLHAFEQLAGPSTALLVVDLQNAFMVPPYSTEVPFAREIVPNVNRLAAATRAAGGCVVWIQMTQMEEDKKTWSVLYDNVHVLTKRNELRSRRWRAMRYMPLAKRDNDNAPYSIARRHEESPAETERPTIA